MKSTFKEIAELDNPQVLLPLATRGAVEYLLNYFEQRSLICMNHNRQELLSIPSGCYKMPANFLKSESRVSLIVGAFDLVYLPNQTLQYWYLAYQYVRKGGYIIGKPVGVDKRFEQWVKAVNDVNIFIE